MTDKTLAERLTQAAAALINADRTGAGSPERKRMVDAVEAMKEAHDALDAKDAEIERLREALRFYADRKDWSGRWEYTKDENGLNIVDIGMAPAMDYGETARAALRQP